jgi:hypothetical protein
MKQRFDELGHKVVDTIKQSEEQSDIIDRLQGTVSACSNLHVKPCLAFLWIYIGHWLEQWPYPSH